MANPATPPVPGVRCEPLSEKDRLLAAEVDSGLAKGLELYEWYREAIAHDALSDVFPLATTFRPGKDFGFFAEATIGGSREPVMGTTEKILYDQPKGDLEERLRVARRMRDQVQEFALKYFMRVADFRDPQAFVPPDREPLPPPLDRLSFCPQDDPQFSGWGFSQLFFKERQSGRVCAFPEEDRYKIVDVREVGPTFDWVVMNVDVFDFVFTVAPFGTDDPHMVLPFKAAVNVVMSPQFIVDEVDPKELEEGVIGKFGFGYATLKTPGPSLLAFGPGEFDFGFENFEFKVYEDGRIIVGGTFAVNQPDRIVNVSLNPCSWGFKLADYMSLGMGSQFLAPFRRVAEQMPFNFGNVDPVFAGIDLINLMTGGQAAERLCISKRALNTFFLVIHFLQRYSMITGTLLTWREIPNWLDADSIPDRIELGRISAPPAHQGGFRVSKATEVPRTAFTPPPLKS